MAYRDALDQWRIRGCPSHQLILLSEIAFKTERSSNISARKVPSDTNIKMKTLHRIRSKNIN